MIQFLSGATALGCAAIALFFVRYWRKSGDRLFAIFALAFGLLAGERLGLAFVSPALEGRNLVYLMRLCAFILIIIGIVDKNRSPRD